MITMAHLRGFRVPKTIAIKSTSYNLHTRLVSGLPLRYYLLRKEQSYRIGRGYATLRNWNQRDNSRPAKTMVGMSIPKSYENEQRSMATTARGASESSQLTHVVRNPVYTNDGREMLIHITDNAVNQLKHIKKKENNEKLMLRVTVESGGCHGFQYQMSLSEEATGDDVVFEREGVRVVIDTISLDFIKDSKIDYVMELIGRQFKIIDNPAALSSCGCGVSFDYKL